MMNQISKILVKEKSDSVLVQPSHSYHLNHSPEELLFIVIALVY